MKAKMSSEKKRRSNYQNEHGNIPNPASLELPFPFFHFIHADLCHIYLFFPHHFFFAHQFCLFFSFSALLTHISSLAFWQVLSGKLNFFSTTNSLPKKRVLLIWSERNADRKGPTPLLPVSSRKILTPCLIQSYFLSLLLPFHCLPFFITFISSVVILEVFHGSEGWQKLSSLRQNPSCVPKPWLQPL